MKWPQMWYRLPVLKKIGRPVSKEQLKLKQAGMMSNWTTSIVFGNSYKEKNTFTFLNQSHTFQGEIQWDFPGYGLLWTYNLNYFEFLVQEDMDAETGYFLIDHFLSHYDRLNVAHDPYPISLRLVFWIRFFIEQEKHPAGKYLQALHQQAKELQGKLEYHLLGNHLLENAFALFISGCYLADVSILKSAIKLLQEQLKEQVLPDSGHFELSPMYHQLMLYRLLDCINMGRACRTVSAKSVLPFLEQTAAKMLGWMQQMTFKNGGFPLFNDAANGIAPAPADLTAYADRLKIPSIPLPLKESGYRKWKGQNWEMIIDMGHPGPSYQPGHAHCDALSFVLQVKDRPVIVDTGTSVYGGNPEQRRRERSTAAHNTVQIDELEQSEIWGEFRMGRKAKVMVLKEEEDVLQASHNGFYFNNLSHRRTFLKSETIIIRDEILTGKKGIARFHFHPDITLEVKSKNSVSFEEGQIKFDDNCNINIFYFEYAPVFGERIPAKGVEVVFKKELTTTILLQPNDE